MEGKKPMINRRSFFGLLAGGAAVKAIVPAIEPEIIPETIPDPYSLGKIAVVPLRAKPDGLRWEEWFNILRRDRILICSEQVDTSEIRVVDLSTPGSNDEPRGYHDCVIKLHADPPKHGPESFMRLRFDG